MASKTKNRSLHGKPRTRREFVAQGLAAGYAFAHTSPLSRSLAQNLADCQLPQFQQLPAFFSFDIAGGCNFAGSNVLVGGPGGQLDYLSADAYRTLGLPTDMHPTGGNYQNRELGLIFHSDSGLLRGIKDVTSQSTRDQVDGLVFCNVSSDDTSANPFNPGYWINKAGLTGEILNIAGSLPTTSGGSSWAPEMSIDLERRPQLLNSLQGALAFSANGALFDSLNSEQTEKVLKALQGMSQTQLNSYAKKDQKKAMECLFPKLGQLMPKLALESTDPRLDADVTAVYGDNYGAAVLPKFVLDGLAGPGSLVLKGGDYHTNTRALGEQVDFRNGQALGRIFELAARKKRPAVIFAFTDGAVGSNGTGEDDPESRGKLVWNYDHGFRSAAIMLVYDPKGRPKLRSTRRQIGIFTKDGAVEKSANVIANSVENLSKAIVANYLALIDQVGKFPEVVEDDPFKEKIDEYIGFQPLDLT